MALVADQLNNVEKNIADKILEDVMKRTDSVINRLLETSKEDTKQ